MTSAIGSITATSSATAVPIFVSRDLLYPSIIVGPEAAAASITHLPSGTVALIPLDMRFVQMKQIIIAQASFTEDFGMRAWISQYPLGMSLISPLPDFYAVSRFYPRPLVLYVAGQTPPANTILAPLQPGQYYLNILNLTNTQTLFSFAQTDLA